jgi:hypothetical protein
MCWKEELRSTIRKRDRGGETDRQTEMKRDRAKEWEGETGTERESRRRSSSSNKKSESEWQDEGKFQRGIYALP